MKRLRRYFAAVLAALGMLASVSAAAPVTASAESLEGYNPITKVLATTSQSPVAMMSASQITAATSTAGCYLTGIGWYDMSGQPIDTFTTDYATVQIRLDADAGSYFADGLQAYLNNTAVDCQIGEGGRYVILTRVYAPDVWAPTITKHPTSENIKEGELTSFVATATGVDKSAWTLIDANGKKYTMEELAAAYPGLTYSETYGKVVLRNVPAALDNSRIYCTFSGAGGSKETNAAYLYVKSAAPTPTPSPSPTPAPSPTPTPSPAGDAQTADTDHEHSYGREWKFDAGEHWHECSVCGEKADAAEHTMTWVETKKATKKESGEEEGVCSVCDYKATRTVEYEKPADSGKWILYAGIGAAAVVVLLMIVSAARQNRARRRRQAARRRRYYEDEDR